MNILHKRSLNIDVESFSYQDINLGTTKYTSESELLLLSFSFDKKPPICVDIAQGEDVPGYFIDALNDSRVIKKAWHAAFEIAQLEREFGFDMVLSQWRCTMVKAARCGYPLGLAEACKAIGMSDGKDKAGKDLINTFCVPQKITKRQPYERIYPHDSPEKWEAFKRYNIQDVVVEMRADDFFDQYPAQPEFEDMMYLLDRQINRRGVGLDIPFIKTVVSLDTEYKERLTEEAKELTGLENPNSLPQLKEWLRQNTGILWKGLDKEVLKFAIEEGIAPLVKENIYPAGHPKYVEHMSKAANIKKYSKPGAVKPDHIKLIEQYNEVIIFNKPPHVTKMLELRKELSNTSVAKYVKMLEANIDGRIYDTIQFNGAARTGRNAGRLIQPQNLPRIYLEVDKYGNDALDTARGIASKGDLDTLEFMYDSVSSVLSQLIRTALVADKGKIFKVADLSAIEARVLAWFAGEEKVLEVFRTHGKIYEATAAMMFNVPFESVTKGSEMRQRGKTASLACIGFGELVLTDKGLVPIQEVQLHHKLWDGVEWVSHEGVIYKGIKNTVLKAGLRATPDHKVWVEGHDKPLPFAAVYGPDLKRTGDGEKALLYTDTPPKKKFPRRQHGGLFPVYDILNAGPRNRFTVSDCLVHNCGYQGSVGAISKMDSDRKIPDADKPGLVKAWRAAHPNIVKLWYKAQELAIAALENPGEKFMLAKGAYFVTHRDALLFYLPSGRYLMYPGAHLGEGKYGPELRFMGQDQETGRWVRQATYGGSLIENLVQAVARDILMHGMLNVVRRGYSIVFSVHDEIVTEMPIEEGSLKEIEELMCQMPDWAKGLPLAAEGFESLYYRK